MLVIDICGVSQIVCYALADIWADQPIRGAKEGTGQVFSPVHYTHPNLLPVIFFSKEIFHESDTIPMECDILKNRIFMSMRFIFTLLNTIIP